MPRQACPASWTPRRRRAHGYVSTGRSVEPARQRSIVRVASTAHGSNDRPGTCRRMRSWYVSVGCAAVGSTGTHGLHSQRSMDAPPPAGQEQLAFGVWTSWRLRFYCVAANTRQWRTPSTWRSIISISSSISGHTGQYHAVYMIAYACGCSLSHVRYRSTYLKCNKMHYSLFKMFETLSLQLWD